MKNILKFFALAATVAVAAISCNKEAETSTPEGQAKFVIRASVPTTKTAITDNGNGTYSPTWNENDAIGVFFNTVSGSPVEFDNTEKDGDIAIFAPKNTLSVTGDQTLYGFYPYGAFNAVAGTSEVRINVKDVQTPAIGSFDKEADLLMAKPYSGNIEEITTAGGIIDLQFARLLSVVKIVPTYTAEVAQTLTGEYIKSVKVEYDGVADDEPLAGRVTLNLQNGEFGNWTIKNYAVVANYDDNAYAVESGNSAYLIINPITIAAEKNITFTIKTDKHDISKTVYLDNDVKFPAGNIAKISLSIDDTWTIESNGDTPASYVWKEASLSSLTSSDVFVIVGTNNNGSYAMPNDNGTNAAPAAVSVTVNSEQLTGDIADNIKWNISGNATDGYAFYPDGVTDKWLYCTSSNNGVRVGTNANNLFTIDNNYLKHTSTGRYLGIYNSQDWRCYTSYTASNIANQSFKFYKKTVSDGKALAEVTIGYDGTVKYGDEPIQLTINNPHNVALTLSSGNTDVATVTQEGVVTILAAGTSTITASWAEQTIDNTIYGQGTAEYNLTVAKASVTVAFSNPVTEVSVGGSVQNVATISMAGFDITYTSSNNEVATVTSDGTVTGVTSGISTITASFAGNDNYSEASDSYTITVGEANDGTLEHPFTATEAATLALGGDTGSYYIEGVVSHVQNQFSASYGTANFWISEDGTSNVFEGYKIKYFNDIKWEPGNAEIAVGDKVMIYGALSVYNSTPETSSGYLVSLNDKTKALTVPTITATPDNNNKQITVEWSESTGTDSAISYVVTCGSENYNASAAGSHIFTMSDYGTYNVSIVVSASDAISATASTSATLTDPDAGEKPTITDVLNREFTGITGTTYAGWSGKTGDSGAVYAGQSAGGNDSIQLRSNNSNSGIITTTSGGKVKKVVIEWQSSTSNGRTLNIYGKNSAYSAATDLYNNSNQGTLLGTIVKGTSTELIINGDYEFIGMRSAGSAMYITSITITWEQ